MARPGPAPTPTHLRIVRGDRKDRINTNEPKPVKKKPKCPTWLTAEAKVVWKRTAKNLEEMELLFEADQDILVAYANAVVNYQRASKIVDTEGILTEGRRDGMVTHPAIRVQRDSAMLIRQLAGELGLTPSSRSRLSVGMESGDERDLLE